MLFFHVFSLMCLFVELSRTVRPLSLETPEAECAKDLATANKKMQQAKEDPDCELFWKVEAAKAEVEQQNKKHDELSKAFKFNFGADRKFYHMKAWSEVVNAKAVLEDKIRKHKKLEDRLHKDTAKLRPCKHKSYLLNIGIKAASFKVHPQKNLCNGALLDFERPQVVENTQKLLVEAKSLRPAFEELQKSKSSLKERVLKYAKIENGHIIKALMEIPPHTNNDVKAGREWLESAESKNVLDDLIRVLSTLAVKSKMFVEHMEEIKKLKNGLQFTGVWPNPTIKLIDAQFSQIIQEVANFDDDEHIGFALQKLTHIVDEVKEIQKLVHRFWGKKYWLMKKRGEKKQHEMMPKADFESFLIQLAVWVTRMVMPMQEIRKHCGTQTKLLRMLYEAADRIDGKDVPVEAADANAEQEAEGGLHEEKVAA